MTSEQRAIAIDCGCPPDRVDGMWVEFVDYWAEIPGSKGLKLSWIGTWRNRVKWVLANHRNGGSSGTSRNDVGKVGGFSGLAARLRRKIEEDRANGASQFELDANGALDRDRR
jgi:hypothetical protein